MCTDTIARLGELVESWRGWNVLCAVNEQPRNEQEDIAHALAVEGRELVKNSLRLTFALGEAAMRGDAKLEDPLAEMKAAAELPAFAGFLAEYETPLECRGGTRFGVAGFLHPELYAEAESNGTGGTFSEVFDAFLSCYFMEAGVHELRGTASEIYSHMMLNDAIRPLLIGLVTSKSIGMRLGQIAAREGYPLKHKSDGKKRYWTISREDFQTHRQGTANDENCPF